MIRKADHPRSAAGPEQPRQRRLALDQRLPRKIPAVQRKEVEDIIDEAIVAPVLQVRLQQREAADAALVLDDDLTVEQRAFGGKRGNRRRHGLEPVRPVLLAASQKPHLAVIKPRFHAVAVELDLVQPFRAARRLIVERGEAQRHKVGQSRALSCRAFAHRLFATGTRDRESGGFRSPLRLRGGLRRSFLCLWRGLQLVFHLVRAGAAIAVPDTFSSALPCSNLLDRAPGNDRAGPFLEDVLVAGTSRFLVLALDEQPVVVTVAVAGTHSHQMPAAVQLLAVEIENEVALGVALVRIAFG